MTVARLLGRAFGALTGTLGVPGTLLLIAVVVGGVAIWWDYGR
ncbi:hypothetical protein [Haloarcula argentinensis]|uniref:Uncharacterized protein n=1 Tax=Haloarcula argentinensis TaxID=43776 RepID=A0A830FH99_HALAR|nr:hypothetical protein [Haloarcula argentinensis]GGM46293.1 hypothetical protein GCM10009006_29500 [Haloarcula argentinensis]